MTAHLRGRRVELETLGVHLDAVRVGVGGVILITGSAGMGKSALLAKAEAMANDRGIRVFHGSGNAAAQVVPLGPLLDALLTTENPLVDPSILRELSRSADQRFWLLRELQERLEQAALRTPILIAVDDLQWADAATLIAMTTLPRRLASHRILWLLAARSGELAPPVRATMGRLEAEDAIKMTLNRLDDAAVAEVAQDVLGGEPDMSLLGTLDGVQGQPFLLVQLLRGLLEDKMVEVDDGVATLTRTQIPHRFVDSIGEQLGRLPAEARDALQMASVLGRRFSVDELAALVDRSPPALLGALRAALDAGLIVEDGDLLAFQHDLVREAVDASLPKAMRRSLRRRAIDAMLAHGAAPSDVAELVMEVAQPGDQTAIGLLSQAAAQIGRVSPTVASVLSRRALDLMPRADPDRGKLVVDTVSLLVRAGHASEADNLIAASSSDLSPVAEAEARLGIAILFLQYSPSAAVAQCRQALLLPDLPAPLRAQLLTFMSCGLEILGDIEAADVSAEDATSAALASRDPVSEAATLVPRAALALAHGAWRQALDVAGQAVARQHDADGHSVRLWLPDAWKALILIAVARLDEALSLIDVGTRAAQQEGISANVRIWSMVRCRALFCAGRLEDARAEAEAVIEMADELGGEHFGYLNHIAIYVLGLVALQTGDPTGLREARHAAARLRSARDCASSNRLGTWLDARLDDADGGPNGAIAIDIDSLDPLATGYLPTSSPRMYTDSAVLIRMLPQATKRAEGSKVLGRIDRVAALYPDFPFLQASAAHARALTVGDYALGLQAVQLHQADPRPLVRAAVLEDVAGLLPNTRQAEALPLLDSALELYATAGAERSAARVRGALRARGARRPSSRPRSSTEWPELSESEVAVVRLVAEGATNREVAERMFISPHTVNSHLRHVFTK
ncbi:MAG TPA: AAA family ATPase, partial [Streptosporangiaceae bacterium]|nr:AAA family ATPase [Streptosporangiaceae bacterium]